MILRPTSIRFATGLHPRAVQWLRLIPSGHCARFGLKARLVRRHFTKLQNLPTPAIARFSGSRMVVLAKAAEDKVLIHDPLIGNPTVMNRGEFEKVYAGQVILVTRRSKTILEESKFGLGWFAKALTRFKTAFVEVIAYSFIIQLFQLASPIFFQVIIDKVLIHRGLETLDVLIFAMIAIAISDVLLNGLRTYVFSHTTSRVDVILGTRLFDHMLSLPMKYFAVRPTGQTVARVRELDRIRDFLTSSALTLLLDLVFTFVFLVLMWYFSPTLTLIVLAVLPVYGAISIVITPILRAHLEEQFQRGATNQAFLVETVSGVETVKTMAVERQMQRRWEEQLAAYVTASFRAKITGLLGSQAIQLVNKVTMIVVLYFGAKLVLSGDLTIGMLVAFNMLAGQVSQPVLRLAQLYQDFQQARISVQRLGDILNTPQGIHCPSGAKCHRAANQG